MEPRLTERDLALLLLSEEAMVALGAVLGLRARARLDVSSDPDKQMDWFDA
jgi:hypothetical protein